MARDFVVLDSNGINNGIFDELTSGLLGDLAAKLLPELLSGALAQTSLGSLQGLLDKLFAFDDAPQKRYGLS